MHRDIRAELQTQRCKSLEEQQKAFDHWRVEFNSERPHEALAMKTPAEVYSLSTQPYTGKRPHFSYPDHFVVRRISHKGDMRFDGKRIFVTEALDGWDVGVEQLPEKRLLRVWFTDLCLGSTDPTLTKPLNLS